MKGFAEYGDVRVSDVRKGSGKKLRLFSKYSMFPGQYAILAMTSKPIAYVTITCHPRFHAKEDYSRLWKQYNPSQFPVIVETLDVRPGNLAMMRNVVAISMVPNPGEYRMVRLPLDNQVVALPVVFKEVRRMFGTAKEIAYKHDPSCLAPLPK